MPNFRRFLSRRWLFALIGVAALLFGLAMLHPYPRQSLFGPTIRGKPWCYWEYEIRCYVHHTLHAKSNDVFEKIRRWFGSRDGPKWRDRELFAHEEMLPLLLELAKDDDKDVRRASEWAIVYYEELHQTPALPVLLDQLHQEDPSSQMYAAGAVWRITKDKQVIPIVMQVLNTPKNVRLAKPGTVGSYRAKALSVLSEIAREVPALFSDVVGFVGDDDAGLRTAAMGEMVHFGNQGIPILLKGLDDPDDWVRLRAAESLRSMRTHEKESLLALERLLLTEDSTVRERVVAALVAMDAQRFGHLNVDRK